MGPQRMFGMTPWVRRLIVANLVVFLLQVTLFVSPAFIGTLGFSPLAAFRQPWTFVTYMFVHGNLLHLAFNLLALYVFGPDVEERMGGGPRGPACCSIRAAPPGPVTRPSRRVASSAIRRRRRWTVYSTRSRRAASKVSPPPSGGSSPR